MAFQTDLGKLGCTQVFEGMVLNDKAGLLEVLASGERRVFYFDRGSVTLCRNEQIMLDRVLGELIRGGELASEEVDEVLEQASRNGQRVVDGMIAAGHLTPAELDRGIRQVTAAGLRDLFFWSDVKFADTQGSGASSPQAGVRSTCLSKALAGGGFE
jgi:hypothetical protein